MVQNEMVRQHSIWWHKCIVIPEQYCENGLRLDLLFPVSLSSLKDDTQTQEIDICLPLIPEYITFSSFFKVV